MEKQANRIPLPHEGLALDKEQLALIARALAAYVNTGSEYDDDRTDAIWLLNRFREAAEAQGRAT